MPRAARRELAKLFRVERLVRTGTAARRERGALQLQIRRLGALL